MKRKTNNLLTIYLGFETYLLNIIECFNNRLGLKKMKGTRRFESQTIRDHGSESARNLITTQFSFSFNEEAYDQIFSL